MVSPLVFLHGLSYDRRQWDPLRLALSSIDPDREVLALDLPGHGRAPARDSYRLTDVADVLHDQVTTAGVTEPPILVGHSLGGVIATVYAARHPARTVINLDQPLWPGPFGAIVRAAAPQLSARGLAWRAVWDRMVSGMGLPMLPPAVREVVRTGADPRPDLLLGYWDEILTRTDEEITAAREADLAAIRERGVAYRWVTGSEPADAYVRWLRAAVPTASIIVLLGSHFPHLEHPLEMARLLSAER